MSKYPSTLKDHASRCTSCGARLGSQHGLPLTTAQAKIYAFLDRYIRRNGYAPTFAAIAEHFEYNTLATVHEHLTHLENKGWIKRQYNTQQSIECLVRLDDL